MLACHPSSDDPEAVDEPTPLEAAVATPTPGALLPSPLRGLRATPISDLPTVLRVSWPQEASAHAWVEFRYGGGEWQQSPVRQVPAGVGEAIVLGVPYGAEVEYRVVEGDEDGHRGTVVHGPQVHAIAERPEGLPEVEILVDEPTLWDASRPWLITSMNDDASPRRGRWWVFVMNRAGEVVWAQRTSRDYVSRHVSVSLDERALLVDRATYWIAFDDGAGSRVVEQTLDGQIHHTWLTPGLHHPFVPLPGGEIAWPAKQSNNFETVEAVDREGARRRIWNSRPLLQELGQPKAGSNALWWHEETDRLRLSLWSADTVFELDHGAGEAVRWFGRIPGSWSFSPPQAQFWWQHGPVYTNDGTLLVSSKDAEPGTETVVREYRLDEDAETLVEVWSFGEGRGIWASHMGEAHRLPNGNTLHVYGSGGHMVEALPDGTVAWEANWRGDKHNGHTTAWDDLYRLAGERFGR